MENLIQKSFSIFCNQDGVVLEIIQDNHLILPESFAGNLIFSIVVPGDVDKILNFFLELKKNKIAIGWEINIKSQSVAETFTFFGGFFGEKIGIAAANTKNSAQMLFTELTRINNEQANIIRVLTKEKGILKNAEEPSFQYFEELSRLNNDLVNIQRELAKKNHELEKLNKLKNQFLGMAAHDLRNPLANIYNFAELLEEDSGSLTPEQNQFIAIIKSSSSFMVNLVNELLDFSIIESGEVVLNIRTTNLTNLINQAIKLNSWQASKKGITFELKTWANEINLQIDPEKINQVITNFITNAIKYSPYNTKIWIIISEDSEKVRIAVRDEGPGIRKEEQDVLFKPFQKTSNVGTAGEKSTGLGLFICKRIVEAHSGSIGFEEHEGAGAEFFFELPKNWQG